MMPMPWKPSKRKGTMPSATATDPVARMESMLLTPLKAKPDEPVPRCRGVEEDRVEAAMRP